MGIDIASAILTASSGLAVTYSGNQVMKLDANGALHRYAAGQPVFRAGNSGTAAAVSIGTVNTFSVAPFNATNVNVGACFNTANSRFTAPVTGIYLFTSSCYCLGGASASWYVHPMFYVNGSPIVRRSSPAGGLYRIRGHGQPASTYDNTENFEIIPLVAGDFVDLRLLPGNIVSTHYPQYARFEGYLLN